MSTHRRRGHDLRQLHECHGLLGVDEAGRGALAGPVVAGAVLANRSFYESDWCRRHAGSINDSKVLSAEQRAFLYERLEWLRSEHRVIFAHGLATVAEIESENILGATRLAMRRAIEAALRIASIQLHPPDPLFARPEDPALLPGQCLSDWRIIIDGRPMRSLGFPHRAIVDGDAKSLIIAMASIVAKVTRDRLMEALDVEAPGYGFARHKGYATALHREALLAAGPTAHHRSLFVRTFLGATPDTHQTQFSFEEGFEIEPVSEEAFASGLTSRPAAPAAPAPDAGLVETPISRDR